MRKLFALLSLLLLSVGGSAAILNVTNANYVVTKVYMDRAAFGCDLIQNGPRDVRVEVRLNDDAKCYWVYKGSPAVPMNRASFMHNLKKGVRVRVTGGRDWDGQINASEVYGQY